jgi:hypothetical protein
VIKIISKTNKVHPELENVIELMQYNDEYLDNEYEKYRKHFDLILNNDDKIRLQNLILISCIIFSRGN